jgi:hypothetical protein
VGEHERAVARDEPARRVDREPAPAEAPALAAVLALQRGAGNRATARLMRQAAQVAVTDVTLSSGRASIPADGAVRARPQPAKATGVVFSLEKGTVEPAGSTVDPATGVVTVTAAQEGGTINVKATSDTGDWATAPLMVSEKPAALATTSGSDTTTKARYRAEFVHGFTGKSGDGAKLEGANVNERFDALSVASPFGTFDLAANAAGSQGWDLDGSGEMAGPDKVSIDKAMIDAGKFVAGASNPAPAKTLPQDFTMEQKLHSKTFPSGAIDAAPFTKTGHVRGLADVSGSLTVQISAGGETVDIPYEGKPVYTNAQAAPATITASGPKPKGKGATWSREQVQVTADVRPADAALVFSLTGDKLGCTIDKDTGLVEIGDKAGTIKVRASSGKPGGHYDEVAIQITPRPAPSAP